MKTKTISAVLAKKLNAWTSTLPHDLGQTVKRDAIFTGGCIASMLLQEEVNDYDVYFQNKKTALEVARYYATLDLHIVVKEEDDRIRLFIASSGESYPKVDTNKKFQPIYFTSNAITLTDKVQIVTRFYGSPKDIHDNYDFVHCMNYWTRLDGLVLKTDALASLLTKELRYIGSKYPLSSIIRTRKFIKRGWTCNAGQYLKMCFQVSLLDLQDVKVLEDQLVGVDLMYFQMIIDELKRLGDVSVDHSVLIKIIDRIF